MSNYKNAFQGKNPRFPLGQAPQQLSKAELNQLRKRHSGGFVRKEMIMDLLQQNPNGFYIKDMVDMFENGNRLETKKSLNKFLYELQKEGSIQRTETNPPLWHISGVTNPIGEQPPLPPSLPQPNPPPPPSDNTNGVQRDAVFDALQNTPNGLYIKDLVNKFNTGNSLQTKKVLNYILYGLQGEGRIRRSESNPPLWSVVSGEFAVPAIPQPPSSPSPMQQDSPVDKEMVLNALHNNPNGFYIKDLVDKFNNGNRLQTKKCLNWILYGLQDEGRIRRSDTNPPLWSIASGDSPAPTPPPSPMPDSSITREMVSNALQNNPNGFYIKDLVDMFNNGNRLQTKKTLNWVLYGMQNEGLIRRSDANPPLWSFISGDFPAPVPPSSPMQETSITKEMVMDCLKNNPNGYYIKDLVDKFNNGNRLQTKKVLNWILYGLQDAGAIRRSDVNPPLWSFVSDDFPAPVPPPSPMQDSSITKEMVLESLQSNPHGCYIKNLVDQFNTGNRLQTKKILNWILYGLQGDGVIRRSETNPPLWCLTSGDFPAPALPPPSLRMQPGMARKETIMGALESSPNGVYLKTLVNMFNSGNRLQTRKQINNMLYALQSEGHIKRTESNPPLWHLVSQVLPESLTKKSPLPSDRSRGEAEAADKLAELRNDVAEWFITDGVLGTSFETLWHGMPKRNVSNGDQESVVQILTNWEKLGISEKTDDHIWNLTEFGRSLYSSSVITLHSYTFQVILYVFGRELQFGNSELDVVGLRDNCVAYGFEQIEENALTNGLGFLVDLTWLETEAPKYRLTTEGSVMFDRTILDGFNKLSTIVSRDSPQEGFSDPAATAVLVELTKKTCTVHEMASELEIKASEITQTLYMLRECEMVEKIKQQDGGCNWLILESGKSYLETPQSKTVREIPNEKEILVAVHSSLSSDPTKRLSAPGIRAIAVERAHKNMTMEQVDEALDVMLQNDLVVKIDGDPITWKLTPRSVVMKAPSTPRSGRSTPSSQSSQDPASPSVIDEMEFYKGIIAKLPNLHILFEKCSVCSTNISALNEYSQGNSVNISYNHLPSTGPDHNRRFQCQVNLGPNPFCRGLGASKKEARSRAAERTCQVLKAYHDIYNLKIPSCQLNEQMDTSMDNDDTSSVASWTPSEASSQMNVSNLNTSLNTSTNSLNTSSSSGKSPISELYELDQIHHLKLSTNFQSLGQAQFLRFVCTFYSHGKELGSWTANSKKDAKIGAAREALKAVRSRIPAAAIVKRTPAILPASFSTTSPSAYMPTPSNTFYDKVGHLVSHKFDELLSLSQQNITGRKVFAGFVMSRLGQGEDGEPKLSVVSIGSGNRCISGDRLTMNGTIVNDSHAEVIARRGLMRFFYQQLEKFIENPADTIFIRDAFNKVRVKPGVEFHLYISTAPCGDGALFSHSELSNPHAKFMGKIHKPSFDNKKQGVLRTKVENGEGCTPIDPDDNVPTWDGLLRGERLRTMSCSDKLMKWNLLGLQGSLLSLIMEPVYMSSLTLGMLYHHGHLVRSLCCRLDRFIPADFKKHIPKRFMVNHPRVGMLSAGEPMREARKTKTREFSINWVIGDRSIEILDGTKGSLLVPPIDNPSAISTLSASNMYQRFKKISSSFNVKTSASYVKTKEQAYEYTTAKEILISQFTTSGCGRWMHKPNEASQFE